MSDDETFQLAGQKRKSASGPTPELIRGFGTSGSVVRNNVMAPPPKVTVIPLRKDVQPKWVKAREAAAAAAAAVNPHHHENGDDANKIQVKQEAEAEDKDEIVSDEVKAQRAARKALLEDARRHTDSAAADGDEFVGSDKLVIPVKETEVDLFKRDIGDRPEEDEDDFNDIAIEDFGPAMLRGMGWKPGEGLGGSRKGLVEAIELMPRPSTRLGLGADPALAKTTDRPFSKNRPLKQSEIKEQKEREKRAAEYQTLQLADGSGPRNYRGIDERLGAKQNVGVKVGAECVISSGFHKGLVGVISYIHGYEYLVKLHVNHEEVSVDKSTIDVDPENVKRAKAAGPAAAAPVRERSPPSRHGGSRQNPHLASTSTSTKDHADKKKKETCSSSRDRHHSSSSSRHDEKEEEGKRRRDDDDHRHQHHSSSSSKSSSAKKPTPVWVRCNVRVRVIDRRLDGGKWYNKKGTVTDVTRGDHCHVLMDDSRVVVDTTQSALETVVPRAGGVCVVVGGGVHVGERGKVLEKDMKKERVTVQLATTLEIITVSLDYVAEWHGQADEDDE